MLMWCDIDIDMNTGLRKVVKNDFEKVFLRLFLGKTWKIWEKIGTFNLQQQKTREIIWSQNKNIIQKVFSEKLSVIQMRKT